MKYLEKEKITEIFITMNKKDSQGWPIPDFKKFSEIGKIIGIDGGLITDISVFPSAIHIEFYGKEGKTEILSILF